MTEQELRALVRDAIARQLGGDVSAPAHPGNPFAEASTGKPSHPLSFSLFVVPTGSDADGPCIIEPGVSCNHCGYCRSYGH